MKPIISYRLIYTPSGNGFVEFLLAGEAASRQTNALPAIEFTALALLLAQKNLTFDGKTFTSADLGDLMPPLA